MNQTPGKLALALALLVASPALALAAGPQWISGDNLGRIDNAQGLAQAQLHSRAEAVAQGLLGAKVGELKAFRSHTDELGMTHVRMQQFLHGKRVYGADTVLHTRPNGEVYLLNGQFADTRGAAVRANLTAEDSLARAISEAGIKEFELLDTPKLVYVVGGPDDGIHLAWRALVGYQGQRAARDYIFADAMNGSVAVIYPTIHYAKSWETFDAQDAAYNSGAMPGVLACSNGASCVPTKAQDAHDGAGDTYDYYSTKFGRDSLDDNGLRLRSSVSVCNFNDSGCSGWNNAAWVSSLGPDGQMVYGDGDGIVFSPLAGDVDVIAHELTHGVTDYTSDLIYSSDSGALNEGLSDIFGASVEAWLEGGISADTWKLGEDVYTPGTPGDALRYMDDPTIDGYSTDYYPDRLYAGLRRNRCNNNNDQCGVHGNSGIANLAYVLLVEGGTHPQGKTSNVVPGVGLATAEKIFYEANRTYFTSGMEFADASTATKQAALDFFTQLEADAVEEAWCAVGVGTSCDGGGDGCINPGGLPVGASCTADNQCCGNKCKGPQGNKKCK